MKSKISQLLLDCLHQSPERTSRCQFKLLGQEDWDQLLLLARQQALTGLLYERLKCRGCETTVPGSFLQSLKQGFMQTAAENLRLQADLHRILSHLRKQHIPALVLKGPHLVAMFYENPALRKIWDIDLLVPSSSLVQAAEILQSQGYQPETPYSSVKVGTAHAQHLPTFFKPEATPVELDWNIESLKPDVFPNLNIDVGALWQKAQTVRIGGVDALGLCTEDLLLHVCIHASYHHLFGQGLRPLIDVAQMLSCGSSSVVWPELVRRSREWNVNRGVYLVLRLAKGLVGANVPNEVLADLRPDTAHETALFDAQELIWSDRADSRIVIPHFAVWHASGLAGKLRLSFRRIFLPPADLAEQYGVAPKSAKLYWYYLVRCKDLMLRHWRTVFRLQGEQELASIAQRKSSLLNYLAGVPGYMRPGTNPDYTEASRKAEVACL
jgi:hypothetical protein